MAGTPRIDAVFDVAVVGFGPTGATLAALLGQAGLKTWVGDKSHEVYDKPRAISMDHEILRVLQQLGIADAVRPHVEPFTPSEYRGVGGRLIKRLTMVEPPYPLAWTPSNVFTQPPVEAALRACVAGMANVAVALGTEVVALAQDDGHAALTVRDAAGATRSVKARYVVGCDGAWSGVREAAGITLEDLAFDEPWLVVDVLVNEAGLAKLPSTSVQYCNPERPCTFVIGPRNHRRWEISLRPGEDPRLAATPAKTWEYLAPWLTPADGSLWRQASYRFHALVAERWRAGRIFIAGDAAHQQPPFLGQGMCQGVRDAANLAWKLAAVCRGDVRGAAGQALLDSYGEERQAHVRALTTRIKAIGAVICERDPAKAHERDARLLAEAGGRVQDTPRQDVMPRLEAGFIARTPHAANGTLFVQPWVRREAGACVRLDDLTGAGWRLVLAPGSAAPAALPAMPTLPGLQCVRLGTPGLEEAEGVAERWFHRHEAGAALVRPDHYVYGVARTPAEVHALLAEAAGRLA